ncbi:hypothetical protein KCMC57_up46580 [Kitasatospora sp. CMC57]|uniref:Uncharacterized protein n=1 Tax=Kitasatospora sp. CMC57 TaxID=3231513 RepID=A0AB33K474_9ACTN
MPFETDLAQAIDRTTDSLEPDLTTLLGKAVERGRSRRRRRSAGVVAGVGACTLTAAAALAIPGALAGGSHAGSDFEPVALAMPRSAITGAQMGEALKSVLPGGAYSRVTGQSNNPSDPSGGLVANGGLLFDDGHGAAYVGASAVRLKLPLRDGPGLTCDQTPTRADGDTCTVRELPSSDAIPGGALVMTEQNAATHPATADTAHRWTMTFTLKSTGAQVQLVQWNSTGGGTGADTPKPTRPAPPLSEQQAITALTGPAWAPILGAVA